MKLKKIVGPHPDQGVILALVMLGGGDLFSRDKEMDKTNYQSLAQRSEHSTKPKVARDIN